MLVGLELPTTLGDPPTSASLSAGITGMSHRAWPQVYGYFNHLSWVNLDKPNREFSKD